MASGDVIVYSDPLSQPCRAVLLFLSSNNISHTTLPPGYAKHEALVEDQTKINLVQLVPEIDHNGFILTECYAILKYLCSQYVVPAHWYPVDNQLRARIDEVCAWSNSNIHSAASNIFIYQVLDPKIKNVPVDRDRLRHHQAVLDRALDKLENQFLARDAAFIGGADDVTIADLIVACELMQPLTARRDCSVLGRPKVAAWMDRVKERLQPHFDGVHLELKRMVDKRPTGRLIYQCSSFDVDY